MSTTLTLNVLPRFPAHVSATDGLTTVIENGVDVVIKPDYGALVPVPSVTTPDFTYFMAWDSSIDYYQAIAFSDLADNLAEQVLSGTLLALKDVVMSANQGVYFTAADAAAAYNLSAFVRGISNAADAAAFRTAIDAVPDGSVTTVKIADANVTTAKIASGAVTDAKVAGEFIRPFLNGLTLSNNVTDAANDIDIATGSAGSNETTPRLMTLASAITKRLDANWAAGTGNGMRWSGEAISNKTYHLFLGTKADGSEGDVFAYPGTAGTDADTPAFAATVLAAWQAETGGSTYVRVRRIGSIIRESAAIVPFTQRGDEFLRKTAILSITAANPGTSAVTRTLNVPTGIQVWAKFN